MGLNINRETGIAGRLGVAPVSSGIVGGEDLTKVAREILSTASTRAKAPDNNGLKIFTPGSDISLAKQVAVNRTGYDVTLSQNALSAINAMKAQAVQSQVQNLSKTIDGKIHINSEKRDVGEIENVFSAETPYNIEVMQSSSLFKDRRGSGELYAPVEDTEEKENGNTEGIDLIF